MRATLTRQRVFLAALGVLVVALILGSVRTTGALWADQADGPVDDITTGTFGLSAGDGSDQTFTFADLAKENMADGDRVSKPLTLVNTGSTPLRFRLSSAGPTQIDPGTATVTMNLAGTTGGACPESGAGTGTAVFDAADTTSPGQTFVTPGGWHALAQGAEVTWCITAMLVGTSGGGSDQITFKLLFHFDAQQTRP
ncbi:hypothetical protein [Gordonia iterans]